MTAFPGVPSFSQEAFKSLGEWAYEAGARGFSSISAQGALTVKDTVVGVTKKALDVSCNGIFYKTFSTNECASTVWPYLVAPVVCAYGTLRCASKAYRVWNTIKKGERDVQGPPRLVEMGPAMQKFAQVQTQAGYAGIPSPYSPAPMAPYYNPYGVPRPPGETVINMPQFPEYPDYPTKMVAIDNERLDIAGLGWALWWNSLGTVVGLAATIFFAHGAWLNIKDGPQLPEELF